MKQNRNFHFHHCSLSQSQHNNQNTKPNQAVYQHGVPSTRSQDFYFPLTTHSVALPTLPQGLQVQGVMDNQPGKQETEKEQGTSVEHVKEDEINEEPLQLPVSRK